jgi:chemotaxis methyl-accepting protein methylase
LQEAGLTDADLMGTDCRAEAIEFAQKGEFPLNALGKLEPWWKTHFASTQNHIRLSAHLKNRPRWKQSDLLTSIESGPWDMIIEGHL